MTDTFHMSETMSIAFLAKFYVSTRVGHVSDTCHVSGTMSIAFLAKFYPIFM